MPIRPENRDRYGPDWPEFSRLIRFERAGGRCECEGECGRGTHEGRCTNVHGEPAYGTGSKVVLTVAHLTHVPEDRQHVRAMCQGCHLHYDREHHAQTAYATRKAAACTVDMFLDQPGLGAADFPAVVQKIAELAADPMLGLTVDEPAFFLPAEFSAHCKSV